MNETKELQVFTSVEELAAVSDAVVVGTVQGVMAREVDYGIAKSDDQTAMGVPTIFYGVAVTETLRGDIRSIIIVGAPDPDDSSLDGATALVSGQQVLLFLKMQTRENAPGVKSYETFFAPVSLSNGVFDVIDGGLVAEPRLADAFEEASYRLTEIRARVRR